MVSKSKAAAVNPDVGRASFSPDEIGVRNDLGRSAIYQEMLEGRLPYLLVRSRRRITLEMEAEWLETLRALSDAGRAI